MIINTDKIEVISSLTLTEFIILRKYIRGPNRTDHPDYKEFQKLEKRLDSIFANAWSSYNIQEYHKRMEEERKLKNEKQ